MLQTPVLLLIFNRPATTRLLVEQVKRQRPQQLFVAADGPRAHKTGEDRLCELTRQVVLSNIDWPCEVKTLFRPYNAGCGKAVSSAIDWFFEHVEEGIILEDDCIPEPAFFSFCTELLHRYRHNAQVMHINGSNFQQGVQRGDGSYYFSRYTHVWGWATWRRAWQQYDFSLEHYRRHSRNGLSAHLLEQLQDIYQGTIDTWDIQWFMTVWFTNGRTLTPNTNLVRNIGYGKSATHTKRVPGWFRYMTYAPPGRLEHPSMQAVDAAADQHTRNTLYGGGLLKVQLKKMVRKNRLLGYLHKKLSP